MGDDQELVRVLHEQLAPVAEHLTNAAAPLAVGAVPLAGLTTAVPPKAGVPPLSQAGLPLGIALSRSAAPVALAVPAVAKAVPAAASASPA